MKYALWTIAGLLAIGLLYFGLQTFAAERVEVVELTTFDEAGQEQVTRLWIVDHTGVPYIRAGHGGSGWYQAIQSSPNIKLTRADKTLNYVATADIEAKAAINKLMQDKYTWGETFIGSMFNRDKSIPIRLIAEGP